MHRLDKASEYPRKYSSSRILLKYLRATQTWHRELVNLEKSCGQGLAGRCGSDLCGQMTKDWIKMKTAQWLLVRQNETKERV